ncbi:MAG TPA: hypothetical protein VFS39_09420, partial [Nitrospira sp.]|nr:hypothetical protein [Nitrospira sp.]
EFWTEHDYGGRVDRWSERSAQESVAGRLSNAMLLLRLAYQAPDTVLFGLGNATAYDPRVLGIYPHFVPLEVLAEEGLVGFALYALVLFCACRTATRCFRLASDQPEERLLLGGLLGLFGFTLVLSLKQGSLLLNLEPFTLAILLGRYEHLLIQAASAHRTVDADEAVDASPRNDLSEGLPEAWNPYRESEWEAKGWT